MQIKVLYDVTAAWCMELLAEARSTGTESLCPEKLSKLDSLSALLQNFARAIDMQAQEHRPSLFFP
jgi:hypothetical protein